MRQDAPLRLPLCRGNGWSSVSDSTITFGKADGWHYFAGGTEVSCTWRQEGNDGYALSGAQLDKHYYLRQEDAQA